MTTIEIDGPAIHVRGLQKSYKELEVLRGVDFDVRQGSIFALLGSNGELGIGAAAQLHVACALPALSAIPSDIIGAFYYTEDILAEPLDSDGRTVRLGDAPGLGVQPRPEIMEGFK